MSNNAKLAKIKGISDDTILAICIRAGWMLSQDEVTHFRFELVRCFTNALEYGQTPEEIVPKKRFVSSVEKSIKQILDLNSHPDFRKIFPAGTTDCLAEATNNIERFRQLAPLKRGVRSNDLALRFALELADLWKFTRREDPSFHKGNFEIVEGVAYGNPSGATEFVYGFVSHLWPGVSRKTILQWAQKGKILPVDSGRRLKQYRAQWEPKKPSKRASSKSQQQPTAGDKDGPLSHDQ
jgi:hypothetical protein